jgi:hypothetical protein
MAVSQMKNFYQNLNLNVLISAYFSESSRKIHLKKGDFLLREGEYNDRLYLVLSGQLSGYFKAPDGNNIFFFRLHSGMFAGVYSFFSKTFRSSTTIIADEDTEVAFIDSSQKAVALDESSTLFEQFMPVVVADLAHRQQLAQQISYENQQTVRRLHESEKLATLGQMAAGISHELNNAIAVLQRGTQWISETLTVFFSNPLQRHYFEKGRIEGRILSSKSIREIQRKLQKRYNLDADTATALAETGITENELPKSSAQIKVLAREISQSWEVGATLHDMTTAANHAAHVTRSVKSLGAPSSQRQPNQDVNETIREALTLLHSKLRKIQVEIDAGELPPITANRGELVQLWVNLIKNAIESLNNSRTPEPQIHIRTQFNKNQILVTISDNGPGIPQEISDQIFQPNFTTKVEGLSFGLGLGLSIVQRIINSYNGTVTFQSAPGKTLFNIQLPV